MRSFSVSGIVSFADKWLGTSLFPLLGQFVGIFIIISAIYTFRTRRCGTGRFIIWVLAGLSLLILSTGSTFINFTASLSPTFRFRFFVLLSVFVLFLMAALFWLIKDTSERKDNLYRRLPGGTWCAAVVILFMAAYCVLATGLMAPQAMIGDEVTHYYMLTTQADTLPHPNFLAKIPVNDGHVDYRYYNHPFIWHYLGAVIYRYLGDSFAFVQLYHILYLVQLLIFSYLLASERKREEKAAPVLYLAVLASLPLTLIFSVSFYQDVPMAAQVVTAFYFLRRNRWLPASLFISLAIGMKVTAMLFFPAFFLCLLTWELKRRPWYKAVAILTLSLTIVGSSLWGMDYALQRYAHAQFYPVQKLNRVVRIISSKFQQNVPADNVVTNKGKKKIGKKKEIGFRANFPGNLRDKKNFVIYGGMILWMFALSWGIAVVRKRFMQRSESREGESGLWLWFVGGSYLILATCFLWDTPDARFFLPGLPFILLPMAETIVLLPRFRWIMILFISLSLMQGGYVLAKTYSLRTVSSEVMAAINYLKEHPANPRKIFMYPEGNYRFFPVSHEWHMNYHLKDFWQADNDRRIEILHKYNIGAIVVKKYLIAPIDVKNITNLGVYPRSFVSDINKDPRFKKVFNNSAVAIYLIPR